jgi:esterase/lipase superfamily enzyme
MAFFDIRQKRLSPIARWSKVLVIPVLITLQACQSHAVGVMTPVSGPENGGQSIVNMLVITSRRPSGDPASLFSGERSPQPTITDVAVSIPTDQHRAAGTVQWPKKLPPNPETDFTVVRVEPVPTVVDAHKWVRVHRKGGRAMVFIHGFNNTFEDAVLRYAQIVHDSGADVTPILFTWPSRASVFDYNYDKESTNFSRTALEQTLRGLSKDPEINDITVLAHSMGTWLAMESLRQMAIRDGDISPKIKNVILASPDIDVDVFAKQFSELGSHRPNFTIFVSQDDKALALSRYISGDVQRLGQVNPASEPYKSLLENAGITVVDLTAVKTGDRLNHGKFAESPEVVQLIGKRLVDGQTLTDSQVGLGEGLTAVVAGTAGSIGKVAGSAVTAPVAVLTPRKKVVKQIEDYDQTLKGAKPVME